MADPRTVLGSTACAWAGGELVATGRLGLLVAGDDHVIVRDAVPVSIPRAGLRIVERRTTGWWNGIAVDASEAVTAD
ncbi:hypothetical protein [Curtobacterium pusillum]|uniref:hypothetical protein n=1 Tax=Curtobacterium pusillum TaxID=69373 RepID=UPI0011A35EA2|nr:hypothetical protein [Curtobacterium pusillum]